MEDKGLYILVEGLDDEYFFNKIIKPIFEKKYLWVKIIQYANSNKEKIKNLIKSINSMNASYIFVTDINHCPCVIARKKKIQDKFKNINNDNVIIVIQEIESWYLAGLGKRELKKLKISNFDTTNDIIKEHFNNLMPKKFNSRIDFMLEILKCFSIEQAKQKNKSFRYFAEKY